MACVRCRGTPEAVFGDSGFDQMLHDSALQAMVIVLPAPNAQQVREATMNTLSHSNVQMCNIDRSPALLSGVTQRT